jgi:hypothetical protein
MLGSLLGASVALAQTTAPEAGYWRADNQTARSITGDIAFSGDHLTINFLLFTIARIRALDASEVESAFHPDPGTQGAGSLYRLQVAASRKFLRKNTLCGSDDTQWMVTWVTGRSLELDFFSGQNPPKLTSDALSNTSDLCGTYTYIR